MKNICKHNSICSMPILSDTAINRYDEKVYGWKHNSFQRPFNINKILQVDDDISV